MAGSCEHGNELKCFMKGREFLDIKFPDSIG
jgi:hypothetical protein